MGKSVSVSISIAMLLSLVGLAGAKDGPWRHSGSMYILTTPDGANLPASASVEGFPLLVRLDKDFFDFSQAQSGGQDLRFSTSAGAALPHEIEQWDAAKGTASIWVRIPVIKGAAQQEIKARWGNAAAKCASNGKTVFNGSNGYIGVWHLGSDVRDVVGNLKSQDKGTTKAEGLIGGARHFPGKQSSVFCGKDIQTLPSGGAPHSTQAWFRPASANAQRATIVGWGNEKRAGKVPMIYASPPQIRMDCYFSNGDVKGKIPDGTTGWIHAVHTFQDGQSIVYINGKKRGEGNPKAWPLAIERPARMWIGNWYDNHKHGYIGEIDEVRISGVARSTDWVRLEYENQKPMQTLVGPVVQDGDEFSVTPGRVAMNEGESVNLTAKAGGAQKIYWILKSDGTETVAAVDRLSYRLAAGRVAGNSSRVLQFKAVYADGVRARDIPVTITEDIPDPAFVLQGPSRWNGRDTVEIVPRISNLKAMAAKDADDLVYRWTVSGGAVIKKIVPGKLILERSQYTGKITVALTLSNGGTDVRASTVIDVAEPAKDPWVRRVPGKDEKPQDGQFYARDDKNEGTLHCNGTLSQPADAVLLKVYADDKLVQTLNRQPGADRAYAFAAKLKPGLIKYRIELMARSGAKETILHMAGGIVCGDAYIIDGQSNALATDTREESPRVTNEWIHSYGRPQFFKEGERENLWCKPVWKAKRHAGHLAELGWWGMELAKRLVDSRKVPIFILNGARGGTRIDQHQRSETDPEDLTTIYGRMLWRVRQAKLIHGIRAILWHQGENDQGAAGPDGDYGWKTYQQYFVEMSAAWKRDFPNVGHYYVFQIWPNSCSMGNGNGDMLREKQRTLPFLYSNMDILSTLGVRPPGPAHFPLKGWAEFARMVQPMIERDIYGVAPTGPLSAPNLLEARYTSPSRDAIALQFDQPVKWSDSLTDQFYLDDVKGAVASGAAAGNVVTLKLKSASTARTITYLKEMSWSQDTLLLGANAIAALTFCNVPIAGAAACPAPADARGVRGHLGRQACRGVLGGHAGWSSAPRTGPSGPAGESSPDSLITPGTRIGKGSSRD